jgi:hypothetical protein
MSPQVKLEALVLLHLAFILFVVAGLLLILAGWACGWSWVKNFWFRAAHLLSIAVVAADALAGIMCPLTIWENHFRRQVDHPAGESALGKVAHQLVYLPTGPEHDIWFRCGYATFGVLVLLTFVLAPPRWPWRKAEVAPPGVQPASEKGERAGVT